jgi:hypothetical protein
MVALSGFGKLQLNVPPFLQGSGRAVDETDVTLTVQTRQTVDAAKA